MPAHKHYSNKRVDGKPQEKQYIHEKKNPKEIYTENTYKFGYFPFDSGIKTVVG